MLPPVFFKFKPRKDRASKLLNYLGEVIVNGNPQVKGRPRIQNPLPLIVPECKAADEPPRGTRDMLLSLGAEKFSKWLRDHRPLMVTDTTLRDAHQSLMAARMRTYDMLEVAEFIAQKASGLFSLEMWGGATYDTCMRFLGECPYERLRSLREKIPNILFQMLREVPMQLGMQIIPTMLSENS